MQLITFGVFDLLHVGHIHLFEEASRYGDLTVVTADDVSISEFKSPDRPIIQFEDRVRMLEAVKYISEVKTLSFTMKDIMERHEVVIREANPDVFVQGEQANHEYIYPVLKKLGIPILTVHSLKTSTTQIIEKIRKCYELPSVCESAHCYTLTSAERRP